jgi:hypothetical protein
MISELVIVRFRAVRVVSPIEGRRLTPDRVAAEPLRDVPRGLQLSSVRSGSPVARFARRAPLADEL